MSNIDRATEIIALHHGDEDDAAKHTATMLAIEDLITPDPQIIRTRAELEALNGYDLLLTKHLDYLPASIVLFRANPNNIDNYLPAVKVAEGAHLRACREALERNQK